MKKYDNHIHQIFHKIWRIGTLIILQGLFSCSYSQSVDRDTTQKKNNQPDVHINVNRELDNNGNVIRYDSTYSWSWSSDGSQAMPQNFMSDSGQAAFFKFFDNPTFSEDMFTNPFGNNIDSLFSLHPHDFYFENFEKEMQEMMQRQQQMMNELFGQPPIIPAPEEKEKNDIQQKSPPKKTGTGVDI